MASISLDLSGGSGSVECQANFNFQVSLVYFPIKGYVETSCLSLAGDSSRFAAKGFHIPIALGHASQS